MKDKIKGILIGCLIGATLSGGATFAKTGTEMIEAFYDNIKIYVDGVMIDPKDATGKQVDPFIYNGTTYLPVRAVGEAIGKTVSYDGETKSVYLGEKPGEKQYLLDVCPPYNGDNYSTYSSTDGNFMSMGGEKYTNGIRLSDDDGGGYVYINLNGKYDYLSFTMGRPDDNSIQDTTVNFYIDDVLVESIDVDGEALPKKHRIPLKKGLQLIIETDDEDVALMDMVLE